MASVFVVGSTGIGEMLRRETLILYWLQFDFLYLCWLTFCGDLMDAGVMPGMQLGAIRGNGIRR